MISSFSQGHSNPVARKELDVVRRLGFDSLDVDRFSHAFQGSLESVAIHLLATPSTKRHLNMVDFVDRFRAPIATWSS